jgi:hypothetical protein
MREIDLGRSGNFTPVDDTGHGGISSVGSKGAQAGPNLVGERLTPRPVRPKKSMIRNGPWRYGPHRAGRGPGSVPGQPIRASRGMRT